MREYNHDLPGYGGTAQGLGQRGKGCKTLRIPFTSVPLETVQATGKKFSAQGVGFGLNPKTDPGGSLLVGVEDADASLYLGRGQQHELVEPFGELHLLAGTGTPQDAARRFLIDVWWEGARPIYLLDRLEQSFGAANFSTSYQNYAAAEEHQLAAIRDTRGYILVQNRGPGNLFIGAASGLLATTGMLLPGGKERRIDTTGAVWAISDGATEADLLEVYA